MNEGEGGKKKKGKKAFDFMTVLGLVLGLGLMVFGIAYTEPPDEPPATRPLSFAFNVGPKYEFSVLPP